MNHFTSKFEKRAEFDEINHKENSETTLNKASKNSIMQKRKNIMCKLNKLEYDLNYLANDSLSGSNAKQKSANYSLSYSRMQNNKLNENNLESQRKEKNEAKSYSIRWRR